MPLKPTGFGLRKSRVKIGGVFSGTFLALRTRELIGEETLLWGSDYPHTDSTWPCSTQVLDEMFEDYEPETRDKITRTNVANLYSL